MRRKKSLAAVTLACIAAVVPTPWGAHAETVLFSSLNGIAATPAGVNSQSYPDLDYETRGADDFSIPGGNVRGWRIQRIEARGKFAPASATPQTVNIAIIANQGSLPATADLAQAIYLGEGLAFTQPQPDILDITLPEEVLVRSGIYWLMVQTVQPLSGSGQWLWYESATSTGSGLPYNFPSAWMQGEPNIGTACVDAWGARIAGCGQEGQPGATPLSPDLAFALYGEVATPGVTVSPSAGLVTSENGGADSFTVVLDAPPTEEVSLSFNSTDSTEGVVPGENLVSLAFTPENWDIPQQITVTGVNDDLQDGDITYFINSSITTSLDPEYGGLDVANVVVMNRDNDTPGFIVTPQSGLEISEAGASATFTIAPLTAPTASVMVPLSSSDTSEGVPDQTNVFFPPGGIVQQTVTISPVDDFLDDGDWEFSIITGDPISADAGYDALTAASVADVEVTCVDDDEPGYTVDLPGGIPIITSEDGSTVEFTVVLDTVPAANVTLNVFSNKPLEAQVRPTQHVFNTQNWDQPVTIAVTGQDDEAQDGDQEYAVGLSLQSLDLRYAQLAPRALDSINLDNEAPLEEGEGGDGEGGGEPVIPHSADTDESLSIELEELLRVIQLFNAGAHHCDSNTEDGFTPGSGTTNCAAHDADYVAPQWQISLSELLRMVQLYNLGSYTRCAGQSEDGFCAGQIL